MSNVIQVADAIAMELNAGPFSQNFIAERKIIPAFELSQLSDLKITVVPKAVEITGSSRSVNQYDIQIDIGIQKHLKKIDSDVSELLQLCDELAEYLRKRPLLDAPWAQWIGSIQEPLYDPAHLLEQRVFTSVLTVTYRALK